MPYSYFLGMLKYPKKYVLVGQLTCVGQAEVERWLEEAALSVTPFLWASLPLHIIIIAFNQTFTIPRPLLNNFFRALVRKVDDLDNKMHSTEKMQSQVFPWYRVSQGKINCGASSEPDFIRNYFLWRRMFFDNRDKCRKTGFLRQKYTIY